MGPFQMGPDTVYLSPAPLYHAAPLRFAMAVMRLGGTVVVMEHFDAEEFLALVEQHRITHTQLVPTMFVRMLKLPEAQRRAHDLSSLRIAIHAAAPCPVPVKQQMIDWWGPIIWEYYAGTEGMGMTLVELRRLAGAPGHGGPRGGGRAAHLRRRRQRAAARRDRRRLLLRRQGLRVPQRPGEDRRRPQRQGLDHAGRHRLRRRRRLPVPDRPQGAHDHLGRRQHLPAGGREPAGHPPQGAGRGGVRRARTRNSARRSRRWCSRATWRRPARRWSRS